MIAIVKISINEFKKIARDRGVLLIFLGAIIIYPFFYPIPYSGEVLKNVPVGLVDQSNTASSRKLVRMINANEYIHIENRYFDMAEAKSAIMKGEIGGILMIPNDFENKVLRGEQATISAYCDASYFLIYRQILTGIYYGAGTFSAGIEVNRMMANGMMMENAVAGRAPLSLVSTPLFNPQGGYATYVVPAVLILLLQQTLLIGIGMLAGTVRENGEVSEIASAHPIQQVLGKSMTYYLIYTVHSVYLFGILFRVYDFPQKAKIFELFLFMTPFLLASIFLALSISAFFKNREISMIFLLFSSIPALFLTGFSWPKESIPDWLNLVAMLIPSTAGVDGFLRLNQMGASIHDVYNNWLNLTALCTIYFAIAVLSQSKSVSSIAKGNS